MKKQLSSYSKKEIKEFINDTRDVPKWGMLLGNYERVYIPIDRMKPDHIQNILNDFAAGFQPLPEELIKEFERLLKISKVKNTKAGKVLYGKK